MPFALKTIGWETSGMLLTPVDSKTARAYRNAPLVRETLVRQTDLPKDAVMLIMTRYIADYRHALVMEELRLIMDYAASMIWQPLWHLELEAQEQGRFEDARVLETAVLVLENAEEACQDMVAEQPRRMFAANNCFMDREEAVSLREACA